MRAQGASASAHHDEHIVLRIAAALTSVERRANGPMSTPDDLYRPPSASAPADGGAPALAVRRRDARVFAGCVAAGSLFWGVVEGFRAGLALQVFGAESSIAGVVALGALRLDGAGVAASAAAVTIVVATHRLAVAGSAPPRTRDLWPILVALPLAAPIAGCLITAAALGVATLGFDVWLNASLSNLGSLVIPRDPLVGVGFGCVLALLLFGAARATRGYLGNTGGRTARILVAVAATQGMAAIVNAEVSSRALQGPDPYLQRAANRLNEQGD